MLLRFALACASLLATAAHTCVGSSAWANDYVVIVLDDSGSMNEGLPGSGIRKMDAAKQALATVIAQIPEQTNVGILVLNGSRGNNHWLVPLGPLVKEDAIARINTIKANGGTPLGEAMRLAADELLRARSKSIYGTYRLIAVTDGEATDQRLLEQYLPDILSRGLVIDAIGVNMRQEHSLATRVHSYRRADDQAGLQKAIVEILAESNDKNAAATQSDFELLHALDDVDAGEILKALATPNNNAVTGLVAQPRTDAAPPPSNFGINPGPASIPVTPRAPEDNFVTTFFSTVCTCMLPIMIAVMIFLTIASQGNRKRRR